MGSKGDGGDGPLGILEPGLVAREQGRQPTTATLAYARRRDNFGPDSLERWNKSPGGSQNVAPVARAVAGDRRWLVELARVWRREGLFGRELGTNAIFYVVSVLRALLWAMRASTADGDHAGAEDIRVAVRAAVGYFALCSVPVKRRRSTWLSVDDRFPGDAATHARPESPTVAVAGNRWTVRRGGHDGDASSIVVRGALVNPARWGLTADEHALLVKIVDGDRDAARSIAQHINDGGWLFGALHKAGWHYRVRRTTEGVEVVYFGPGPNGNTKMCCSVCIVRMDGSWVSVRAWPGGWEVIDDGDNVITRSMGQHGQACKPGEVVISRLRGDAVWQLDLVGAEVTFAA